MQMSNSMVLVCLKCGGTGTISKRWIDADMRELFRIEKCWRCQGKGKITVPISGRQRAAGNDD